MRLKVLSYNIHKGFDIGNRLFVLRDIKTALKEMNADILFLQEVQGDHSSHKWKIDNWKTAAQFEYIADMVWDHHAYGKNAIYPQGHHGNAILSKFPIVKWHNHDLTLHKLEQRGLLHAEIDIPRMNGAKKKVHLFNTHINLLEAQRIRQVRMINEYVNKHTDGGIDSTLFVGDFNDWTNKVTKLVLKEFGFKEIFNELYGRYPATFPSRLPILSLDRVFYKNLKPVLSMTLKDGIWRKLSDHLPVYAEFEIEDF